MTSDAVLRALIFCMEYAMSQITDDDEYSEMVDLQNELKEELRQQESKS